MILNNHRIRICFFFLAGILILSCNHVKYKFGERLYNTHCGDCHMNDGSGLSSLYPSLINQNIVDIHKKIPCIIRNGINDTTSIIQMLPLKNVSEVEITNIINYILQDLNDSDKVIYLEEVNSLLNECEGSE